MTLKCVTRWWRVTVAATAGDNISKCCLIPTLKLVWKTFFKPFKVSLIVFCYSCCFLPNWLISLQAKLGESKSLNCQSILKIGSWSWIILFHVGYKLSALWVDPLLPLVMNSWCAHTERMWTSAHVSSHVTGMICRIFRAYWSIIRLWKIDWLKWSWRIIKCGLIELWVMVV